MKTVLQLDVGRALVAFGAYCRAVAGGRPGEAIEPRHILEDLGLLITWQPGRSEAAPKAPGWPMRERAQAPADPIVEKFSELVSATRRRDFRAATRHRRELNALGFNILIRPQAGGGRA